MNTDDVEAVARSAADWLLDESNWDAADPSLYHGLSGIVLGLHEAHAHFGDDRYGAAIDRGLDILSAQVDHVDDASLYFGLAGMAFCLHQLGRHGAADQALRRVRDKFDGVRWNTMFELLMGNAGIGLGALHAGDVDLAIQAVLPYVEKADRTPHGVNWAVRPTQPRSHHMAHGTLGIAFALATVGSASGRSDLMDLAVLGADDVVSRNTASAADFLVPHSDPPHRPDIIERYSYGWCNGPAGDAQLFRLLSQVTGDERWGALQDRCWTTVVGSGLPSRLQPGFWDNNGHCCGTAGVLATACDRIVERGDDFAFADLLVADLLTRATVDDAGARWSNYEQRADPPELAPLPGWAMGNAGILRELLRYVRLRRGDRPGYAIEWPDQKAVAGQAFSTD
ncbi:lanthionine synthetase LanC family protein [Flexivirga alba]|uniref:Lanthionine synthetase LanC family protein n=1 Tax=Flexivirga alba TaxID=702742 RepID=A0ABW2AGV1_9MICO